MSTKSTFPGTLFFWVWGRNVDVKEVAMVFRVFYSDMTTEAFFGVKSSFTILTREQESFHCVLLLNVVLQRCRVGSDIVTVITVEVWQLLE